ncbi:MULTISPECIES: invasion associated locus B family protein [Bradyrhizobium]|uniref:Invasion protein IalB n=1 Tax=Bradyrhizobium ottawaense TaxID=931866 RepID=A0ABV4G0W0_9BRAD|nr:MULTISPECIES: invasion associated locus B family protein [Bradyrhizobium]MBR1289897.1 invasion associated locus B family protein [Bradyrhizobium ottawaense]MDA9418256.1 invasion protein B [Bradyrhizobium sp. CCBAU 25360]MDA9484970.1 invasion protein B [Bradyrhizobium sp. CCBAU 11445]PDT68279.1 invasion associated locus B family protein [Bradyrhizobium ottawaense]WLB48954.1 invasion associated locus B family protein [Bradyrhizobium ottawaense]
MTNARDGLASLLLIAIAAATAAPGHAAPKGAQAERPAEVATRGQREAKDISYGGWQKLCFKAGGAPTLCRTSITGQFATGQTAVRVDLIEREDAAAARLQLFVPVGMYLQQSPRLSVDQGAPFRLPYTWCLTNLCIAADVAAPKIIREMESGKTLTLELVDSNLLAMTTSIPLAQFATVRKGTPARTLEQDIDE